MIKLGPSGGVYLGGEFGRVAGATRHDLAKVSKTGALTSRRRGRPLRALFCPPTAAFGLP